MDKGFAVISKNQKVITTISDMDIDDLIELRLKDGSATATITTIKEN